MTRVSVPERGVESLFGTHDENLRLLEKRFKVRIRGHGNELTIEGDTIVEADETFTITLGAITPAAGVPGGAGTITPAGSPATGTIVNDDSATLTLAIPAITESNADQTVIL